MQHPLLTSPLFPPPPLAGNSLTRPPPPGNDTEAHDALARRLSSEPPSDRIELYKDWLANNQEFKTLMLSHQTGAAPRDGDAEEGDAANAVVVGGKYKCFELGCKHYVYGFETSAALRRHMELHEEAEEARRDDVVRRRAEGVDDLGVGGGGGSREGSSEGERGVNGRKGSVVFGNGNGNANGFGGGVSASSPFAKRAAVLPNPEAEGRRRGGGRLSLPAGAGGGLGGVRTAGPCLRCKVLKKKVCFRNPLDRSIGRSIGVCRADADECSAIARTRVRSARSRMSWRPICGRRLVVSTAR